jgi:hypothetical protein
VYDICDESLKQVCVLVCFQVCKSFKCAVDCMCTSMRMC